MLQSCLETKWIKYIQVISCHKTLQVNESITFRLHVEIEYKTFLVPHSVYSIQVLHLTWIGCLCGVLHHIDSISAIWRRYFSTGSFFSTQRHILNFSPLIWNKQVPLRFLMWLRIVRHPRSAFQNPLLTGNADKTIIIS